MAFRRSAAAGLKRHADSSLQLAGVDLGEVEDVVDRPGEQVQLAGFEDATEGFDWALSRPTLSR
jgi:hypothetical protein